MNLKSKLFGTLAASAIALSVMGGVASADTASVGVELLPDVCGASIEQSAFSFGTWKWDDESQKYVPGDGATYSNNFSAKVRVPYFGATCPVLIQLQNQKMTDGTKSIPGSELQVNFTSGPLSGNGGNLNVPYTFTAPRVDVGGTISMDPRADTYQPGDYTGTIEFVINQGT